MFLTENWFKWNTIDFIVTIPYKSGQCFLLNKETRLCMSYLWSQSPINRVNVSYVTMKKILLVVCLVTIPYKSGQCFLQRADNKMPASIQWSQSPINRVNVSYIRAAVEFIWSAVRRNPL